MHINCKHFRGRYLFEFCLAIIPILNIYRLNRLSIVDIVLIISAISIVLITIFLKKGKLVIRRSEQIYLVFLIISFLISLIFQLVFMQNQLNDFISKWGRIIIFALVFVGVEQIDFNYNKVAVTYVKIAIVVSMILIVQGVLKNMGIIIFPYLKNLSLNYNISLLELVDMHKMWFLLGIYRPASIFPEPAAFAQYACLALVFTDIIADKKKSIFAQIIITLAIIISGSANGIALILALYGIKFIRVLKTKMSKFKLICLFTIICFGVLVIYKTEIINQLVIRIASTDGVTRGATGNLRLLQGLAIFKQLPIINQVFGLGFGNVKSYLITNSITTPYLIEIGNEYMNAFSTVLVSTGVLGSIIFLNFWILLLIEASSTIQKQVWLVLTALFITSSIFFSPITVMYLIFIKRKIII